MTFKTFSAALILTFGSVWTAYGCSGGETNNAASSLASGSAQGGSAVGGNTSNSANGGSNSGTGGGNVFTVGAGGGGGQEACAQQSEEATLTKKPVDIIIVIDNSGSMGQEIKGVQDNINQNFAQILNNSGIDYRVIMVTEHGPLGPESVCIEAPLSGIPQGGCASPPAAPINNPPIFFHYDHATISSHNALCKLLDRYDKPDDHNEAPMGYRQWLRPEALKVFVAVTDDGVNCGHNSVNYSDGNSVNGGDAVATLWDQAVLALDPNQFGTSMDRNYMLYSLVALANKDANNPATPWLPSDPITTAECPSAADPGTGYQGLSNLTGALKFPICEPMYYDTMFNEIAKGVIAGAKLSCEFPFPEPPMGKEIDPSTVVVQFTPSMGAPIKLERVADATECGPNKFYMDEVAKMIYLCPDTCTTVEGDDQGKIAVLFGCKSDVN